MLDSGSLPSKKGLKEAQELFRKLRKKEPSPELIKIIEEVTMVHSRGVVQKN